MGPQYKLVARITTKPKHAGVKAVKRTRQWLIFALDGATNILCDPVEVYEANEISHTNTHTHELLYGVEQQTCYMEFFVIGVEQQAGYTEFLNIGVEQ